MDRRPLRIALYKLTALPAFRDPRGSLAFLEESTDQIPFPIKRVFWIHGVPSEASRGGHAYLTSQEGIVCLSGACDVVIRTESESHTVTLRRPTQCLLIGPQARRSIVNCSTNAIVMVVSSTTYSESDYVRE